MRIDLHTHSDVSDGTGSPAELTAAAAASLPRGLTLLPGVELSCRWHGGSRPIGLHLLGYLFDPRAHRGWPILPDELIVELAAAGLFGLEADHPDHGPAEREHVRGLAAELDLVVTGSSEYYGRNKPLRLGEHTTAPRGVPADRGGRPGRCAGDERLADDPGARPSGTAAPGRPGAENVVPGCQDGRVAEQLGFDGMPERLVNGMLSVPL